MAAREEGGGLVVEERLRLDGDAVEWREVEGEIVALDVARSEYLSINPSGTVLWRALEGGATRSDLVRRLEDEFGIDADAARRDVDAFLESLVERRLLAT